MGGAKAARLETSSPKGTKLVSQTHGSPHSSGVYCGLVDANPSHALSCSWSLGSVPARYLGSDGHDI